MHPKEPPAHPQGAIDALVEAERAWSAHLDAVRAEAARLIADARADAGRAVAAARDELAPLVEHRQRELDEQLASQIAEIARRGRAEADRYASASDETVRALATRVVRRVPWLAGPATPESRR